MIKFSKNHSILKSTIASFQNFVGFGSSKKEALDKLLDNAKFNLWQAEDALRQAQAYRDKAKQELKELRKELKNYDNVDSNC